MPQRSPLFWPLPFCACAVLLGAVVCGPAYAQLPAAQLTEIHPAGGAAGSSFDVKIFGADLDGASRLEFSHPGISAQQKMAEPGPFDDGPQPVPRTFEVKIAPNVPLGLHEARAVGKYGASNPRAFLVGDVPEALETEPNNSRDEAHEVALPLVVNGRSQQTSDVDFFTFQSAANQRLLVECRARRIDSKMDAVVAVYDQSGRIVGSSRDEQDRDPLVDFTARAGSRYVVKVYDAGYQGGDGYGYRLSIGALPHIDYVFPPAGQPGNRNVTVFGRNLPGGQAAGVAIDGRPLEKTTINVSIPGGAAALPVDPYVDARASGIDATMCRVKNSAGSSNAVLVGVASAPPVMEKEDNDAPETAQPLDVPCEVTGQFYPQRDDDWYQFTAAAGESFTFEIISQRMGAPTAPMLLVQQIVPPAEEGELPQVKELAVVQGSGELGSGREFDTRSDDPLHQFTAEADGAYRLLVRDRENALRADPRHVYRLVIRRPQPDFRLVAYAERSHSAVLLRSGGQASIRVVAFRRDGFEGAIQVTAGKLPPGVTCSDAVIGPANNTTTLVLSAAGNVKASSGSIEIVGTSDIAGRAVRRSARLGTAVYHLAPAQNNQPPTAESRLSHAMVVSTSPETAPVAVSAGGGKDWEIPRTGTTKIPYTRSGSFKGKIDLQARDLPPNVDDIKFSINPNNNSGEFEVKLKNNTPPGTYSFYLSGTAEKVKYARNPEAAEAAAQRKAEVDKIHAETIAAEKAAAEEKAAADKAASDAEAAVKSARDAQAKAEQELARAQAAAKDAADKAAQAQAAAAKAPDDANLKTAAQNAQKGADDAAAKLKAATEAVAAAEKTLAEAMAKAETAAAAKAEADEKAAAATERAKLATELKARTDKLATDTAEAAKPKDVNVPVVSTPVTLKITPAPITMAVGSAKVAVKQGEQVEVPVTIKRLYGFNDTVKLGVELPSGVSGLSIPDANIGGGQTQAKLTITAAENATPGEHSLVIEGSLRLNNQNLSVEQPLTLTVQAVEKKAAE